MTLEQGALPEENESTQDPPSEEAPKTEEQETQPPELPEKYQGKTAADIAKMLEDREATITRQGEELGSLRNETAFYRNQPRQQQSQPAPQETEVKEDYDWTDPKAVDRLVEKRITQYEQKRQQEEGQRRVYETRTAFMEGQKNAIEKRPDLFEGIGDEVAQLMEGWVVRSQGNIDPRELRDPETWFHATSMIRNKKSGFKKSATGVTNPTTMPATETPSSVKPRTVDEPETVSLNTNARLLAKKLGMTDDDMKEAIKKERDERRRKAL